MSGLHQQRPLNLLYRGNLDDTAMLVGLVHMRVPIRSITLADESDPFLNEYIRELDQWLINRQLPRITRSKENLETAMLVCPRKTWAWGKNECIAAIRLSGLCLPPAPQDLVS